MNKEITLLCPIYAAPGKGAELKKQMMALAEATRKEAGNVCYKLHAVDNEPEHFIIYEKWRNQDALDFHMNQPYLKAFIEDKEHLLKQDIAGTFCREF